MRYVRYVGLSHQRGITAHDWQSVGVKGETVFWNAQNGFAIALDRFTDDQIRKAIDPDPNFIITRDDEDFTPTPQVRDMVPAEATQAAEAPVDVLAMVGGEPNDSVTGSGPSSTAPGTRPAGTGGTGQNARPIRDNPQA